MTLLAIDWGSVGLKAAQLLLSLSILVLLHEFGHYIVAKFCGVKIEEFSIGFEIFNMFDVQNSITNTWVRDVYSKRFYGIPNYMTQRVLNIKMDMKF